MEEEQQTGKAVYHSFEEYKQATSPTVTGFVVGFYYHRPMHCEELALHGLRFSDEKAAKAYALERHSEGAVMGIWRIAGSWGECVYVTMGGCLWERC